MRPVLERSGGGNELAPVEKGHQKMMQVTEVAVVRMGNMGWGTKGS